MSDLLARVLVPVANEDVADAIVETAEAVGASSILFVPRGGSRWRQLVSGDVAQELVSEGTCPVVALPRPDESDGDGGDDD